MENKPLYVFRKMSSTDKANHLIARLHRDVYGTYHIEPLFHDPDEIKVYGLPILTKARAEEGRSALYRWLSGFLPPLDNGPVMAALMNKFGMTEYDEWEWLKHYRPEDSNLISFS